MEGSTIAGFRILREIGRGGMGVVYLAKQEVPDREVALKVVGPELAADPAFRDRFIAESNAAASAEHPNIIPVYAAGFDAGALYLAMRYVRGNDLADELERGPVSSDRAVGICAQVGAALSAAHELGLVHRDVKPGNILLDEHDHAYLVDFGLIRRSDAKGGPTRTGQFLGSVAYCAPEQIRGDPIDGRTDLYSLGCVLLECLTGSPPFPRESEVATMYAHLEEPPPRPSDHAPGVPPGLDDVVTRAMAKRPEDRYPNATTMVSAMRSAVSPTVPASRRHPPPVAIAAAVVSIVVIGATIVLTRSNGSEERSPPGEPSHSASIGLDQGLLVVDPVTGEEVARYPGNFGGSAFFATDLLAAGNGAMWTTEQTQVLKVDPSTGEGTPVPDTDCTFDAIATGLGSTWVVCPGSTVGIVVEVDPVDLSGRDIEMPGNVGATTGIGTGRATLWIAASGLLVRFDELDRRAALIEGVTADDVAVDRQGVWVVDELAGTVTRLDVATGAPLDSFEIPGDIDDLAAGFGSVWVLDGGAGTVTQVDPETGETADPIGVGPGASAMSIGFGSLWVCVPDEQRLVRIDPLTGLTETFDVAAPARVAVADPVTSALWLLV